MNTGTKKYYAEYFRSFVFCVLNLAFLCNCKKINTLGNGKFVKAIELLDEFNLVTRKHNQKVASKQNNVHYLVSKIQNEIVTLLKNLI